LIALPYELGNLMTRTLFSEELWLVTPPGKKHPRRVDISAIGSGTITAIEEGHCCAAIF